MNTDRADEAIRSLYRRLEPQVNTEGFCQAIGTKLAARKAGTTRRRIMRVAMVTGLAVAFVAVAGVGVYEALTHLGQSQEVLVITDEPTTALGTTTQPSAQVAGECVNVLHPYHNVFLDAPTYLIPASISLTHPLPEFPKSIPAQRITSELLPDTDLRLVPKPAAIGLLPVVRLRRRSLAQQWASQFAGGRCRGVARAFPSEHGLWDEAYSAPQVSVGSSEDGPGGTSVTSWAVRFEREPVAAGLERYVSVRVAGNDEVIQLTLALPRLKPVEGKLVRLRPIAEVVADTMAWQTGDSGALQNEIQEGEVPVNIRSAFLAYQDPRLG